jgi:hypothetical protein
MVADNRRPAAADALDLVDLLIPFATACTGAVDAALVGSWLDASLLAAGCSQVVEDHIHRSEGILDRVSVHLTGDAGEPGAASRLIGAAASAVRVGHRARPQIAPLLAKRDALNELAVDLSAAASPAAPGDRAVAGLPDRVRALLGPRTAWPSGLAGRCLRLPSSFRSFDQHPADIRTLAGLVAERLPDRDHPMLVVGIRTSGSYLAPIVVAELRRLGYVHAELITMRAQERLDRSQVAAVERVRSGTALLIDDPPVSGGTVRDCIRPLVEAGLSHDRIALLLALPDGWELAPFLDRYVQITLPGSAWHLTGRFEPGALATAASHLLAARGERLEGRLEPVSDPVGPAPGGAPRTPREHRRAAHAVAVVGTDGAVRRQVLIAQGVGIGLFGRHDLAIARHITPLVPDVIGVCEGVLFQLVDGSGPPSAGPDLSPEQAAGYVLDRHRSLGTGIDRAADMRGRKAAWEVAAMLVGGALGRVDIALRMSLVLPVVRRILRVDQPSVVDGRMTEDRFLPTADGRVVKADFADGAFSNRDLWSYDPIYDLAAIGDELGRPTETLDAWNQQGGAPVDPSRWMLLRLVAAWDRHRHGALAQPSYGRLVSRILADHVGAQYLPGLAAAAGPWCALDVDGVIETAAFAGASAPGDAGGRSLRALAAHGYRALPVTGRSASEVAERCAAWGLEMGVAEYGSVLVHKGHTVDLRDEGGVTAVERARAWLAAQPGIVIDPAYQHSVRAWRLDRQAQREPLDAADLAGLHDAVGDAITTIAGEDQVDVIASDVSKEGGIRHALQRVDPVALQLPLPLAFAAGDGPADVAMLAMASVSVAPAHAADTVRAAATQRVTQAYQAGLAEGVGLLLGHRPGGCPTCAPQLSPSAAALMGILSIYEGGLGHAPARLARLIVAVSRS